MATNKKVTALASYLREEMAKRLAILSTAIAVDAALGQDTDLNPLFKCGTGSVGAAGGLVKILPFDWPNAFNIIGQQSPNYGSQSVVQFVREASVAGNTLELTMAILATVASTGAIVEVYECANGTAPSAATLIAANLKYRYLPNFSDPLLSQ